MPISGGPPKQLDLDVARADLDWGEWLGFQVHPDGHRVTYALSKRRSEVWALESFLPETARKR